MNRDFCLGSEWLYYKIYTGAQTTDYILLEKLYSIISNLEQRNIIQKWFFIRYNDNDSHFRIRFLVQKTKNIYKVIKALYPVLNELLRQNLIWKIQTDTYKRELERYGENTIEDSEFLFWKDSQMILQYISLKKTFEKNETPLFFSFYSIDSFLSSFSLSNLEKYTLMNSLQHSFKEEFEIDTILKKELDKKYRELENEIESFLDKTSKNDFPLIFEIVDLKQIQISEKISDIKNKIQISISDFLSSHIHMMLNRQYTSKQRMYELVIYDHLYRHYKKLHYKNKFIDAL